MAAIGYPPNKDYQTSYTQFSTFREETSHGLADPYFNADSANKSSRTRGKQLASKPAAQGRLPDSYFDKKIRSLADGDQYQDPADIEKEIKEKLGGKNASDKSFFPPKNGKKGAYPGDPSACMGTVGLFGSDWKDKDIVDSGPSIKGKKNLYSNPSPQGGCGYPLQDRSIGRSMFKYMPDPYQNGRAISKQLKKTARERISKPFNAAPNTGAGMFNANPFQQPAGPLYRESKDKGLKKGQPDGTKPFRAPGPSGKGAAYCTLSNVGRDYVPGPAEEAPEAKGDGGKEKPFKPCGGIKERLSMWTVNPYQYDARPPPDLDFTLFD